MLTVLSESGEIEVDATPGEELWLSDADTTRATGWTMKPEGFCRGEVCVPLPKGREDAFRREGRINVSGLWDHMGRPAPHSEAGDVWVLGEGSQELNGALASLEAPDFTLPDFEGRPHSLSDFRDKKVLLITWASW